MAKLAASVSRVYVNGYDMSGYLNTWGLDINQNTPVVTCLSDAGPRRVIDNYDHSTSYGGFFDTATSTTIDPVLAALRQSASVVYVAEIPSLVAGTRCYENIVYPVGDPFAAQVGGAETLAFTAAGAGGMSRAWILRTATISGTGNGTGVNIGTTTSGQTFGVWFRVLSGTFTSISMKIQGSSDDGGGDAYADVSGLVSGSMTTNNSVVYATATSAMEAYARVVVTAFSGTSVVVLVTAGLIAGT